MKHVSEFTKFLTEEVNLNKTRIETLTKRVETIEDFLNGTEWSKIILKCTPQGSWAHKTIIKPPGDAGFDADLIVFVTNVSGWTARDFILKLRGLFVGSKTYKDLVGLKSRCVTLTYAGDFELDVVPCVVQRPNALYPIEVCNRSDDKFEPTDSERYTQWFQQRSAWTGNDHLIHVMRLFKYLRDTKQTFSCKSILLNALVAERVTQADALYQPSYFPDLPTALRTLISRLDDHLQARPNMFRIPNPVLQMEDFNRHWDQDKYANFRQMIHTYRQWTDEAYNEPNEKQSIRRWRKIFGDEFARGADVLTEEVRSSLIPIINFNPRTYRDAVEAFKSIGRSLLASVKTDLPWIKPAPFVIGRDALTVEIRATLHMSENSPTLGPIYSGQVLQKGRHIRFEAVSQTGVPYAGRDFEVQWQVVNTDSDAAAEPDGLRGGFYRSKPRSVKWECTKYRGVHWVQAFVISKRSGASVGRSSRFFIVIE